MSKGSLSDAIQGLIDNIEYTAVASTLLIKEDVKKDWDTAAKRAVDQYYLYTNGYYTKHGREYNLYKSYKVSVDASRKDDVITISAKITMDPSLLEGLYHSNSKKHIGSGPWEKGGDVEASYVFKNFIKGQHPWTTFNPTVGDDGELDYHYKLIQGKRPTTYLNNFVKKYGPQFDRHVQNTIGKLLKSTM